MPVRARSDLLRRSTSNVEQTGRTEPPSTSPLHRRAVRTLLRVAGLPVRRSRAQPYRTSADRIPALPDSSGVSSVASSTAAGASSSSKAASSTASGTAAPAATSSKAANAGKLGAAGALGALLVGGVALLV